jgi:CRP-like cAMP-binding protein
MKRTSKRPTKPALNVDRLREVGIFGALSDDVLDHIATAMDQITYTPGQTIFAEGDPAREMYVVLDGEVEVLKRSRRGRDTRVAILGPNDAFGEMSIIDVQPRSATVRALGPTRLLRVRSTDLDALYRHDLKAYAILVLNIARDLSRRLRVTDGLLADFTASVIDEYIPKRS